MSGPAPLGRIHCIELNILAVFKLFDCFHCKTYICSYIRFILNYNYLKSFEQNYLFSNILYNFNNIYNNYFEDKTCDFCNVHNTIFLSDFEILHLKQGHFWTPFFLELFKFSYI